MFAHVPDARQTVCAGVSRRRLGEKRRRAATGRTPEKTQAAAGYCGPDCSIECRRGANREPNALTDQNSIQ
jgi:hypothetical protein